jgi:peroxiredoxin (alkyl hydroperoxide reductase subunit C)
MIKIGEKFPEFNLKAVVSREKGKEFKDLSLEDYKDKWKVIFFWPLDFTFVCPTEIAEFSKAQKDFSMRDAQVIGFSADSHFVHLAWREHHEDLKDLQIPMVADYQKELSSKLDILHPVDKVPLRATFILDQDNIVRFTYITDLSVGRNVKEVLRVLDALQTDELCPCNWEKGQKTL